MKKTFRKLSPALAILALFITCSLLIQGNSAFFLTLLSSVPTGWLIAIYLALTIATVLIPFSSILPFMPLAVLMLGWQLTAFLTAVAWIVGTQVLFELSRSFARPYLLKLIPKQHVKNIGNLLAKKGLVHAFIVRMTIHDDFVSIAFGIFTKVSRWEFLLISVVTVVPGAVLYAYLGALPLTYALLLAALGIVAFLAYWIISTNRKAIVHWFRTSISFRC